ncbi:MAG: hypothetical protein ACK54A_12350, partial [Sphingobacteriales bacterium]
MRTPCKSLLISRPIMLPSVVLATVLLCLCLNSHAQDNSKRDSLWMILQNSQQDTIKVLNLLLYGEQYE